MPLLPDRDIGSASQPNKRKRRDSTPGSITEGLCYQGGQPILTSSSPYRPGCDDEWAPLTTGLHENANDLQQPQMSDDNIAWIFPEAEFLRSRPAVYDSQDAETEEELWFFQEEDFLHCRSVVYDPPGTQMQAENLSP